MMFAVFVIEREPMRWDELPAAVAAWLQIAGGVAGLALAIYCLAYLIRKPDYASKAWTGIAKAVVILTVLAGVGYLLALMLVIAEGMGLLSPSGPLLSFRADGPPLFSSLAGLMTTVAGLLAILAVTLPLICDAFTRFSGRRIGAIARLSLKEAIRSRVVWVFGMIAVILLFVDWFVPYKPEDQVRNYVRVIYWSLTPLFILTASMLGAFSIPTDVKNQSIHTIVTKPVERFEIVLGRFLGYALLLTVGMVVLTAVSLLYVVRGVTPQAAKESFTARMPVYGDYLWFQGTSTTQKGESVGREWDYRSYIAGPRNSMPNAPRQYAVWSFLSLPGYVSEQRLPYFEFSFDIYRLSKGQENRGVLTIFTFADGRLSIDEVQKAQEVIQRERNEAQSELTKAWEAKRRQGIGDSEVRQWQVEELGKIEERLIDKFGVYQVSDEVVDYHTQSLGGEDKDQVGQKLARLVNVLRERDNAVPRPGLMPPMLNVIVSVDRQSGEQMLGVAKGDLYLLAAEGPFWLNFVKGILGLWLATLLMLGLAVALSTYLSGVIAWLCALFIFGMGFFSDSIREMASGQAYGGGVIESTVRIVGRIPGAKHLEDSPAASVIYGGDAVFRFGLRLFANVVPDIDHFDLHTYVANGYDISWGPVLFLGSFVSLVGYLLPWAVLAYYLMKFREVANPM